MVRHPVVQTVSASGGVSSGRLIHVAVGIVGAVGGRRNRSGWVVYGGVEDGLAFGSDGGCSPVVDVGWGVEADA